MNPETTLQQDTWPELPLAAWRETYATLHMWTQVVGKVRLALAPMVNHWWQVPLYVTCRGLTTSTIPCVARLKPAGYDHKAFHVSASRTEALSFQP